jgi:hypothetical protein
MKSLARVFNICFFVLVVYDKSICIVHIDAKERKRYPKVKT